MEEGNAKVMMPMELDTEFTLTHPLYYADEPRDGGLLVAPLGVGVKVNTLLLKHQL